MRVVVKDSAFSNAAWNRREPALMAATNVGQTMVVLFLVYVDGFVKEGGRDRRCSWQFR
jgi:hypothetical protein